MCAILSTGGGISQFGIPPFLLPGGIAKDTEGYVTDDSKASDLNNRGDYISGDTDKYGDGILVGKGLTQTTSENNVTINLPPPPPPGHFASTHPIRQYTLADVVAALIGVPGDPLTGQPDTPGLVSQLTAMVARLESIDQRQIEAHAERSKLLNDLREVKTNQYPRVFQILMIAMAISIIVLLLVFVVLLILSRMR